MYQYEYPHPAVTTDVVAFTVMDGDLRVLLIRRNEAPFKSDFAFLADESFKCKHLKRYFSMECEEK